MKRPQETETFAYDTALRTIRACNFSQLELPLRIAWQPLMAGSDDLLDQLPNLVIFKSFAHQNM